MFGPGCNACQERGFMGLQLRACAEAQGEQMRLPSAALVPGPCVPGRRQLTQSAKNEQERVNIGPPCLKLFEVIGRGCEKGQNLQML